MNQNKVRNNKNPAIWDLEKRTVTLTLDKETIKIAKKLLPNNLHWEFKIQERMKCPAR